MISAAASIRRRGASCRGGRRRAARAGCLDGSEAVAGFGADDASALLDRIPHSGPRRRAAVGHEDPGRPA